MFGHYWDVPPDHVGLRFAPGEPNGTNEYRDWAKAAAANTVGGESVQVPDAVSAICIDYSGYRFATDRACLGAYRWPEQEVVWTSAES